MLFSAFLALVASVSASLCAPEPTAAQVVPAQTASSVVDVDGSFAPIRTDSPRQTLETFLRLMTELDQILLTFSQEGTSRTLHDRILLLQEQAGALLDLSAVPLGTRRSVGGMTALMLADIFGRVELPDLESVPDVDDARLPTTWRVPGTPIRVTRVAEGPREGEYLFSGRTIDEAPRFLRGIEELPLRTSTGVESWSELVPQLTGPLIPAVLPRLLPESLKRRWWGTPVWKVLLTAVLLMLATYLLTLLRSNLRRMKPTRAVLGIALRAVTPIAVLLTVRLLDPLVMVEVNVSGTFAEFMAGFLTAVVYVCRAWLFWLVAMAAAHWLVGRSDMARDGVDAQLTLLVSRIVGFTGCLLILAYGAQALGLPILSLLTGLGIGGLAVALAIRPTLENLIGGVMLFLDRPVSVGDFCTFGDTQGFVESIGVRTTKLRGVDRTLITVPNAAFADMQLVNWAKCDKMMIETTIGLRYETDPDQMRYVLAKLREMCHAHPKIDTQTIRIRFVDYSDSSLDIAVRVYAWTRDWNDFFAIREDVLLRIQEIVQTSGTDFALPSQTMYMTRDPGVDEELGDAARTEVATWRASGDLPFPEFSAERVREISDTLDWPPRGSVEGTRSDEPTSESLSAESPLDHPG